MATLSIKEAVKLFKVARSTLYVKMDKGELSRRPDKTLDFAELVRVFGEPSDRPTGHDRTKHLSTKSPKNPDKSDSEPDKTRHAEREAMLTQRIRELEGIVEDGKQRELWLRTEFEKLTDAVKLLEMSKQEQKPIEKPGFWRRLLGG